MDLQQVLQPRSSANGFGRRKVDREMGTRTESKLQLAKSSSSSFNNAGLLNGSKVGVFESPSRDRLIFVSMCLIGHSVEVHVKNGSILSGIFHATNAEKDFGIVLKMARVTKDCSLRGQKLVPETVKGPQTMIIPARELVQVIAKDVPLIGDGFSNGNAHEKRQDLMIDSVISQSHHVDVERELERWTPDKDDPQCPELENIFDGTWTRNWDQFETNEALFGVKSTFDEEIYTTRLERGLQTRELEREALRIAREIEGDVTQDLHLAEERGMHFGEDFDLDEESRFSSVYRGGEDGLYEENENTMLDASNTETFGGSFGSGINRSFSDVSQRKINDGAQTSSSCSSLDKDGFSLNPAGRDAVHSDFIDHVRQLTSDCVSENSPHLDDKNRLDENEIRNQDGGKHFPVEYAEKTNFDEAQTSKSDEIQPSLGTKKTNLYKGDLSPSATAYASSSLVQENKGSLDESSESTGSGKSFGAIQPANPRARPGSATSSTSERVGAGSASNGPGMSPSSSVGSLSSEKSTLNPYAKEFKFNPNAKSYTPTSLRPHAPVSESSFYYATNVSPVPHIHGLPVGIGIGPSFGGHQSVYNPQAVQMQAPQAYANPNGPLYGQQMILGQPRPFLYMPSYPPEMLYKGRDF